MLGLACIRSGTNTVQPARRVLFVQVLAQPAQQVGLAASRFAEQQQRTALAACAHPLDQVQALSLGVGVDARDIGFGVVQRTAHHVARKRIRDGCQRYSALAAIAT